RGTAAVTRATSAIVKVKLGRTLLTHVRHDDRYSTGSARTSETINHSATEAATPWIKATGRPAARAASSRARSCARHQTIPANGTCASLHAASRSSLTAAATSARSEQTMQAFTWARSSSSQRAGQRPLLTASSTSCSRSQYSDATTATLHVLSFAAQERRNLVPRPEQEQPNALGLHTDHAGNV